MKLTPAITNKKLALAACVLIAGVVLAVVSGLTPSDRRTDYVSYTESLPDFPFAVHDGSVGTASGKVIPAELFDAAYFDAANEKANESALFDRYYGEGSAAAETGFDISRAPSAQKDFTAPGNPSFDREFAEKAVRNLSRSVALYARAEEAGEIDAQAVKEEAALAAEKKLSVSGDFYDFTDYLLNCGFTRFEAGCIIYQYEYIKAAARACENRILSAFDAGVTDEDVNTEYKKHRIWYDVVDFRAVMVPPAAFTSDLAAEEFARQAAAVMTDAASFRAVSLASFGCSEQSYSDALLKKVRYADMSGSLSEETVSWLFSRARAAGDVRVEYVDGGVAAFLIETPARKDESRPVNIRRLSVTNPTGGMTDEELLTLFEDVRLAIDASDGSEADFGRIVEAASTDMYTAVNGGLAENVNSSMLPEEVALALFATERSPGDIITVELTGGGWEIIYFISYSDSEDWYVRVREELSEENGAALDKELSDTAESDVFAPDAVSSRRGTADAYMAALAARMSRAGRAYG